MGPWRPSSVPETSSQKKKKKKKSERASARPAFEFVGSGGGAQNAALGLAPRLGGRPSLEMHFKACWRARSRPGRVRGAARFSRAAGTLTPSQRPARRQRRRQRRRLGRRLPRFSAGSRDGGGGCCCGRRTPPPLSPYRTRGPDCALALRPAAAARSSLEWRGGPERPPPERGGPGRKCAGRRRRAGGGGEQARRAAAAPLAPQSHTPGSPGASAAPLLPGHLFGAAHTDDSSAKHHGRRRPQRRPPGRG